MALGVPAYLPDAHVPGRQHKNNVHKGGNGYHKGTHAHGKHDPYRHGALSYPGEYRPQRSTHDPHHHLHASERRPAGPRGIHRQHSAKHRPAGQQPGKELVQPGMEHKLHTGAHHPASVTAGLNGKPPAHDAGAAPVSEPRAFDEDELFAREFDEDELFSRELDEELLARSLADELIARKVNVGQIFDDALKILRRGNEEFLARDDEEEFVARDMFFDDLD